MKQTYRQYSNQPKKRPSKNAQIFATAYLVFSAMILIALAAVGATWTQVLGLFNFTVSWINAMHKKVII